jgi:hypothetical protein
MQGKQANITLTAPREPHPNALLTHLTQPFNTTRVCAQTQQPLRPRRT